MTNNQSEDIAARAAGRCKQCAFGVFHPSVEYRDCPGEIARAAYVVCRRYPPSIELPRFNGQRLPGAWPTVGPDSWCGEFRAHLNKTDGEKG